MNICETHGGYNNIDDACLFCTYQDLTLLKRTRCACKVEAKFDKHSNLKAIKAKRCRRHS